jgi:hypothetical protein
MSIHWIASVPSELVLTTDAGITLPYLVFCGLDGAVGIFEDLGKVDDGGSSPGSY